MPKAKIKKLTKHAAGFGAALAFSRVLGYVRDAAVVAVLGAGFFSDAFYAAFRLVNFFRRTVAEGAVNGAVMPALNEYRAKGTKEAAAFFSKIFTLALIVSAVLCLLAIIFIRPLIYITTAGFAENESLFSLTAELAVILLPSIIFILLASLCQGAVYLTLRFFVPAAAPVSFSAAVLVYLVFVRFFGQGFSGAQIVTGLALSALLGAALQLIILVPFVKKEGYSFNLANPFGDRRVAGALALFIPALVCSAGDQISMFMDMFFASFLYKGSVTAVYNATQVMQLPLAVFGASSAAGVLAYLLKNKTENSLAFIVSSLNAVAFVLVPASFALAVLAPEIIKALFEHGKFTAQQTLLTAGALRIFALGLCAHGANKIM